MEGDYLFSKELRDRLACFSGMSVDECLASPEFFNKLLDHVGASEETRQEIWKKVGTPECNDIRLEEGEDPNYYGSVND